MPAVTPEFGAMEERALCVSVPGDDVFNVYRHARSYLTTSLYPCCFPDVGYLAFHLSAPPDDFISSAASSALRLANPKFCCNRNNKFEHLFCQEIVIVTHHFFGILEFFQNGVRQICIKNK